MFVIQDKNHSSNSRAHFGVVALHQQRGMAAMA